jgi:hypothetical protein
MHESLEIWTRNGVQGRGHQPPVEGFKGPLLVCGSSPELWDDLNAFFAMGLDCDVACINFTILHYPYYDPSVKWRIKHAICFDPGVEEIVRCRKIAKGHRELTVYTHSSQPPASCVWNLTNLNNIAFSASFASAIGLAMGYERIILAGCAQNNNGHFYDMPGPTEVDYGLKCYMLQWTDNTHLFRGKVKSMSGKTREFFGSPTPEWIRGEGNGVDS